MSEFPNVPKKKNMPGNMHNRMEMWCEAYVAHARAGCTAIQSAALADTALLHFDKKFYGEED